MPTLRYAWKYIFNDFSSRHCRSGVYLMVIVPKSGRPVLGHIEVYSGKAMLISYPENWLGQHSISGNWASMPRLACSSVYSLTHQYYQTKLKSPSAHLTPKGLFLVSFRRVRRGFARDILIARFHSKSAPPATRRNRRPSLAGVAIATRKTVYSRRSDFDLGAGPIARSFFLRFKLVFSDV